MHAHVDLTESRELRYRQPPAAAGGFVGPSQARTPIYVALLAFRLWPAVRLAQGHGCAALGLRLANFSPSRSQSSLGKLRARTYALPRPSCRPTSAARRQRNAG